MPKMRIAASLIMLIQILLQAVNLPEKMATILTSFGEIEKLRLARRMYRCSYCVSYTNQLSLPYVVNFLKWFLKLCKMEVIIDSQITAD